MQIEATYIKNETGSPDNGVKLMRRTFSLPFSLPGNGGPDNEKAAAGRSALTYGKETAIRLKRPEEILANIRVKEEEN